MAAQHVSEGSIAAGSSFSKARPQCRPQRPNAGLEGTLFFHGEPLDTGSFIEGAGGCHTSPIFILPRPAL